VSLSSKLRRETERVLVVTGALLLIVFLAAQLHRTVMLRIEMDRFKEAVAREGKDAVPEKVETSWPIKSLPEDRSALALPRSPESTRTRITGSMTSVERPIAILRIPKLRLEVPVLNGTDAITLNRGVGRIQGTAFPGQPGNIGIAGHRDGFFRGLGNIRSGDKIELLTAKGTDTYVVDQTLITHPDDLSVLDSGARPALTLITCYPFHYIGPAPRRFVVEASRNP
jgi:sortase A